MYNESLLTPINENNSGGHTQTGTEFKLCSDLGSCMQFCKTSNLNTIKIIVCFIQAGVEKACSGSGVWRHVAGHIQYEPADA